MGAEEAVEVPPEGAAASAIEGEVVREVMLQEVVDSAVDLVVEVEGAEVVIPISLDPAVEVAVHDS